MNKMKKRPLNIKAKSLPISEEDFNALRSKINAKVESLGVKSPLALVGEDCAVYLDNLELEEVNVVLLNFLKESGYYNTHTLWLSIAIVFYIWRE